MIVEKVEEYLATKYKVLPQHVNRASELGHPCLRYLVYLRTHWQYKEKPGVDALYRFHDGNLHEEDVIHLLNKSGIKVIEQQRPFFWTKYKISGHIDGKVMIDDQIYPLEIKAFSPNLWISINSIKDIKNHKYVFVRKYAGQINIYMLLDNHEKGVILMKNKASGKLKEIWVELDYDLAEEMIQKAEKVNKHVDDGTLPERIEYDEEICGSCPFLHICSPDIFSTQIEIVDDDELKEKIDRWWELKPVAEEFRKLDQELNQAFKDKKLIIGNYVIDGKWVERKGYTVPDIRYWKKTIRRVSYED